MDCSLRGSFLCGISQARILEWVAISSARRSSWPRDWTVSPTLQVNSLPLNHQGSPSVCSYPCKWQATAFIFFLLLPQPITILYRLQGDGKDLWVFPLLFSVVLQIFHLQTAISVCGSGMRNYNERSENNLADVVILFERSISALWEIFWDGNQRSWHPKAASALLALTVMLH